MSQTIDHERQGSHRWTIPIAATCLGLLIGIFWVTAAHGDLDVPRAVIHWLTGTKPESVSRLYDEILWAAIGCVALIAISFLSAPWSSRSSGRHALKG